ncbi:MAG: type II toxin-antitoxin system VapC family toxin [Candidatus Eremiobacteraeota bacterium]|nr:type II toxin-antitoxin system VapC family toxin [Candidatus Eremiobacteraeota bacterium]
MLTKGMSIAGHDLLIAGACLCHHRPLYTRNVSHFSRIEGLQLLSGEEIT